MDNKDLTRPSDIIGLVDYQTNSVVSRTIISDSSGTVTAFAFDAGTSISEHSAPFDAIVMIIEGGAKIKMEGFLGTIKAGQMLLIPGGVPHALEANNRFKMLLTMIRVKRA